MKKQRYLLILVLALVGINNYSCGTSLSSLKSFNSTGVSKPTAHIEKFEIKKITLRDITFLFHIGISNPYPVVLSLSGVDIDFFTEGKKLFNLKNSNGFKINANGKATNIFELTLKYSTIVDLVNSFTNKDSILLDLKVAIHIPLPKLPGLAKDITLKFDLQKKIPAILPKVNIKNFKVKVPSLKDIKKQLVSSVSHKIRKMKPADVKGMFMGLLNPRKRRKVSVKKYFKPKEFDIKFKVSFNIVLKNKAAAKLKFTDTKYRFLVNGAVLVDGLTSKIRQQGSKTILTIVSEFSSKNLGKTIQSAFKSGRGSFLLEGGTRLILPGSISNKPLDLSFSEKGNFNLR